MKERIAAKRYAKGLVGLSLEELGLEQLSIDARRLEQAMVETPHFLESLSDARVDLGRRLQAVRKIGEALNLSAPLIDTILLLLRRGRGRILPLVVEEVKSLVAWYQKMAHAKARVAAEGALPTFQHRIEEALTRILGLSVQCEVKSDPSLLGGFVVTVGDLSFDASIAGNLSRMQQQLIADRGVF